MTLKLTWTPDHRDPRCYRSEIGSLRLAAYGHGWHVGSRSPNCVLKSGEAIAAWRDNALAAEKAVIEVFPEWIESQQKRIDVAIAELKGAFQAS